MLQALLMAMNIARIINDLAKQAQGANGSKLGEITSGIDSLSTQMIGMMELAQRLIEGQRDDLTPEEKQSIKDTDDRARDVQRRVLGATNDESGDPVEQAKRREKARKESPEFKSAHAAAEERSRSR